jgi:tetratricopeptide (TPR) repeat protein
MVPKPYLYHGILIAGLSALYVFVLWIYPISFNFELDVHWHNSLLFFSIALYCFFLAGALWLKMRLALAELVPAVIIALLPLLQGYANEHLTVLVSLLVATAIMYRVHQVLWVVVLVAYLFELALGVWQYAAHYEPVGTLGNSGVYACYITVHLPLVMYALRYLKLSRYLLLFFIALNIALLYVNFSRTAIISFVVIMALMYAKRLSRPVLVTSLVLFFAGAVIAGSHILNGKRLSALGRVMKVDIAKQHLDDDVLFGTGIGRFSYHYPQWQAAYFRQTEAPPADYYLSAGESYILFNEYLQLYLEAGLIGLLLFSYGAYVFFKTPVTEVSPGSAAKLIAAGILACGFTSYPFHIIPMLFLLALCFVTVRPQPVQVKRAFVFPALALSLVAGYFSFERMIFVEQWKSARHDYSLSRNEALSIYSSAYNKLNDDGKFLADYAAFLMQEAGNCQPAAALAERSKQYFICTENYYTAATAYKCLGNYDKAIENYQFISWYIPVLYRPKYEMALLYRQSGNNQAALALARQIIDMPVKIASPEIDQMKAEMKQWISNSQTSYK